MTYQNDPNRGPGMNDGQSYMGWIVGGALVLALIVGVFAYSGSNTNTASNNNAPAASSGASTTGSGGAGATGSGGSGTGSSGAGGTAR